MFSGLLDPLRRNIGVRLSLWYALIFLLSSAAVFTLTYYILVSAVAKKDREVLDARLKEAAVVYQASGADGLDRWVRSQPPEIRNTMFVRVVNPGDQIVYVTAPPDWLTFRDSPTDWQGYHARVYYLRIPQNEERDYTLLSGALPHGSL